MRMRRIAILALVAIAAAIAFGVGFTSTAHAFGSCGNDTGCYSVPDGCGVGVGCNQVYCSDSECPNGSVSGRCWYCDPPPM